MQDPETPRSADDALAKVPALDGFRLEDQPGHLIRRCQQRALNLFLEERAPNGPRPRQFAVLVCVYQNPGLNQTDLVRLSGIDRSTAADVVSRLVRRGLLKRQRLDGDQRANALSITEAGIALLRDGVPRAARTQARLMEPIPEELREVCMSCLRLLAGLPAEPGARTPAAAGDDK